MMRSKSWKTRIVFWLVPVLCACGPSERETQPEPLPKKAEQKKNDVSAQANADIEAFDDFSIVAVSVPDFAKLSFEQKKQLYLLGRAAAAEREVRSAFASKDVSRGAKVLSGILEAKSRVPASIYKKVEAYANRFLLSDGFFDAWTGAHFRPSFIPGELAAAAQAALSSGVDLGLDTYTEAELGANQLEQLDRFLASLRPSLFNIPPLADKGADKGASTGKHADGPATTKSSSLSESGSVAPVSLKAAASVSAAAASFSTGEKTALERLSAFFKNKDRTSYRAYVREWQKAARDRELVAFFEDTPGAPKATSDTAGRFQMIAAVMDEDQNHLVQKVANKADYFERNLPGNAMFRRAPKKAAAPVAAAYFVTAASPWSAPVDLGALTYPSAETGGKTLLFLSAAQAREKVFGEKLAEAFSPDKQTLFMRLKWRESALCAYLILKNVIGNRAGARKPDTSSTELLWGRSVSPAFGVLEEVHSDLVALYFAFDPKVQEIGLIPEPECARALLALYAAQLLEQAADASEPGSVRNRQVVARRVVTRGLLRSGAASVEKIDGRFYVIINDMDAARKSTAAQLAETQRMLFLGALGDAQALIDMDGGPLPKAWRKDAEKRLLEAGVRPKTAYLFPMLTAEKDNSGKIKTVTSKMPESLPEWITSLRKAP